MPLGFDDDRPPPLRFVAERQEASTGEGSLGQTASRGARLAFVGWAGSQGLTFAAYIALAHLVSPSAFGSFTAGSLIIGFGSLVAESGTLSALINRRERILEAASTAFYSLVVSGIALTLGALAISPLIGLFFRDHAAGKVAAALAAWLLLRSLTIVPDALLQRRLSFARRVAVDPLGAIAFAAVSIVLCARGAGVWGLVGGTYASEVVEVAAAWGFARFRPRRWLASWSMWREITAFARPVLASEILRRIASQMDIIMLGRFDSAATLGQYRNGFRLAQQPGVAFVDVGGYVLQPVLAHISEQPQRLSAAVRRAYGLTAMSAIPVSAATVVLGVPIAVLCLGDRWRPAGHAIAALWGLLAGGAFVSVAAESIKAARAPRLLVRLHTLTLVSTVVFVCAATIPFGLIGVASAVSLSQAVVAVYAFALVHPLTGMGWSALVRELAGPLAASAAMVAAMLAFAGAVDPLHHGEATGLALTAVQVALGAVVYLVALPIIDPRRRVDLRLIAARLRPSPRSS
ncbi:MAG: oligosaccharide flippase family protein [Solirubrobacterales bacterium]|nr:oligosaccharide flippase family protein [Solirubrobacterales bacterium]